ncbi:MAG TPA: peptidoglycan editing factor PgeF [Steroidobacteraceae bacterium]|nr:peptidoglycan editing factor PgeF [Steroidobacteraceae bacterium]
MIRERDGISWIEPQWPVPYQVRAASTLRMGGTSTAPFDSLNLALHVGDAREAVLHNRRRVARVLNLPGEPCWLQQVHGINVVAAGSLDEPPVADASFTTTPGQVCAVMTADCLPVLLCNRDGTCVAAAHAGWRGLSAGVLEATIRAMNVQAAALVAWLGPAIGRDAYEVGDEVRDVFIARNSANDQCFTRNKNHRWLADMNALARNELRRLGVDAVFNDAACTANDTRFFSYRRDGRTGRMASMIWLQPGH